MAGSLTGSIDTAPPSNFTIGSVGTNEDWLAISNVDPSGARKSGGGSIIALTSMAPGGDGGALGARTMNYGACTTFGSDGSLVYSTSGGTNNPNVCYFSTASTSSVFTLPAGTGLRTATFYLDCLFGGSGQFTAHLSDSSAADYTVSISAAESTVTVTYNAATASQTLICTWAVTVAYCSIMAISVTTEAGGGGGGFTAGPWLDINMQSMVRTMLMRMNERGMARSRELPQPWFGAQKTTTAPFYEEPRDHRQARAQVPENSKTRRPTQDPPFIGSPLAGTRAWWECTGSPQRFRLPADYLADDSMSAVPPPGTSIRSASAWSDATQTKQFPDRPILPDRDFDGGARVSARAPFYDDSQAKAYQTRRSIVTEVWFPTTLTTDLSPFLFGLSAPATGTTTVSPDISALALQTNDILIFQISEIDGSGGTPPVPPAGEGWALLVQREAAGSAQVAQMWWKRWGSGSTDTTNPTFTDATGTAEMTSVISVWRGCITAGNPYDQVVSIGGSTASNTMTAPNATSIGINRTAVRHYWSDDNNSHGSQSEGALAYSFDKTGGSFDSSISCSYLRGIGIGATGTATMAQSANGPDNWDASSIVLRPPNFAPASWIDLVFGIRSQTALAPRLPMMDWFFSPPQFSDSPDFVQSYGAPASAPIRRATDESWWRTPFITIGSWFDAIQERGVTAPPPPRGPAQRPADYPWWKQALVSLKTFLPDVLPPPPVSQPPINRRAYEEFPSSSPAPHWDDFADLRRPLSPPVQRGQEGSILPTFASLRAWLAELPDRAHAQIPLPKFPELWSLQQFVSTFVAAAWADLFDRPRMPPAPPPQRQHVEEPWFEPAVGSLRSFFETTPAMTVKPPTPRAGESWNLKTAAAPTVGAWAAWAGDAIPAPVARRQVTEEAAGRSPLVAPRSFVENGTPPGVIRVTRPSGEAFQPAAVISAAAVESEPRAPRAAPTRTTDAWSSGPLVLSLPGWVGEAIAHRQTPPRPPGDSGGWPVGAPPPTAPVQDLGVARPRPLVVARAGEALNLGGAKVVFVEDAPPRPQRRHGPRRAPDEWTASPAGVLSKWGWQPDEFFRNVPLNTPRERLFDVVSVDFLPSGHVVIHITARAGNSATKIRSVVSKTGVLFAGSGATRVIIRKS